MTAWIARVNRVHRLAFFTSIQRAAHRIPGAVSYESAQYWTELSRAEPFESIHRSVTSEPPIIYWDWAAVSAREDISLKTVRKHMSEIPWDWKVLSTRMHIDVVRENIDLPWDLDGLAENPSISEPVLLIFSGLSWAQKSRNPNLTWESVFRESAHPWDWDALSARGDLTWHMVCSRQDLPWNPDNFAFPVTLDMAVRSPWLAWNIDSLSEKLPIDDIVLNADMPWNWKVVSARPGLDMVVACNPDLPWEFEHMSPSPEFVQTCPDRPWNWDRLYQTWSKVEYATPDDQVVQMQMKAMYQLSELCMFPNFAWFHRVHDPAELYATVAIARRRIYRFMRRFFPRGQ